MNINEEKQQLTEFIQNDGVVNSVEQPKIEQHIKGQEPEKHSEPTTHRNSVDDIDNFINTQQESLRDIKYKVEGVKKNQQIQKSQNFRDILTATKNLQSQRSKPSSTIMEQGFDKLTLKKVRKQKKKSIYKKLKNERIDKLTTSQVVLPQSGYWAVIQGLTGYELRNLENPEGLDFYTREKYKYELIYKKIINTSIGHMTFEEFLDNTSIIDEPILFFGLFNATYPNVNKYPIPCTNKNCSQKYFVLEKHTEDLLLDVPEDTQDIIIDIVNNPQTKEIYYDDSLVKQTERFILDSGRIIVDCSIPTISEYLERLGNKIKSTDSNKYKNIIAYIVYVNTLHIYDDSDGEEGYIEFDTNDKDDILIILEELSLLAEHELEKLEKAIDNMQDKYILQFGVENVTCPHCKTRQEKTTINFADMLFINRQQEKVTNQE